MIVTTYDGIRVRGTAAELAHHILTHDDECFTVTDRQARRITKRLRRGFRKEYACGDDLYDPTDAPGAGPLPDHFYDA